MIMKEKEKKNFSFLIQKERKGPLWNKEKSCFRETATSLITREKNPCNCNYFSIDRWVCRHEIIFIDFSSISFFFWILLSFVFDEKTKIFRPMIDSLIIELDYFLITS